MKVGLQVFEFLALPLDGAARARRRAGVNGGAMGLRDGVRGRCGGDIVFNGPVLRVCVEKAGRGRGDVNRRVPNATASLVAERRPIFGT